MAAGVSPTRRGSTVLASRPRWRRPCTGTPTRATPHNSSARCAAACPSPMSPVSPGNARHSPRPARGPRVSPPAQISSSGPTITAPFTGRPWLRVRRSNCSWAGARFSVGAMRSACAWICRRGGCRSTACAGAASSHLPKASCGSIGRTQPRAAGSGTTAPPFPISRSPPGKSPGPRETSFSAHPARCAPDVSPTPRWPLAARCSAGSRHASSQSTRRSGAPRHAALTGGERDRGWVIHEHVLFR